MLDIHQERILILDFGSQYSQLIARRVREIGAYCEIWPYDVDVARILAFSPKGIILSGGPETVTEDHIVRAPEIIFTMNCPILGICYGLQTMATQLGGKVVQSSTREFGLAHIEQVANNSLLLSDLEIRTVWMSHGDSVVELPPGFQIIASTTSCPIAAIENADKHFYGLQFHPEVTHTPAGKSILERFVKDICGCALTWTIDHIIESSIASIRKTIGENHVILALSGGVDSSVLAMLLSRAIGQQLHCVFVDNGLMRLNEAEEVAALFADKNLDFIAIEAQEQFLSALKDESDPENKRKIVGKIFIDVFTEKAKTLNVQWLAQGTIYPDVIESGASASGKSKVIKTHHNVGGLPENISLQLIEPLRELFKDEVRELGRKLGLPEALINRHPFPGPGLCVRILGEIKPEYLPILRQADHIFITELRRHHLYDKVSQAFAVFLPIKSVGVLGDGRAYDYVIALRAVETIDFMTAKASALSWDFLQQVSARIVNEVPGVARVVYDITSKPPATIEWE